jgi:hypothetical protein
MAVKIGLIQRGAKLLHGPHHGAQKSTNTGLFLSIERKFEVLYMMSRLQDFNGMPARP